VKVFRIGFRAAIGVAGTVLIGVAGLVALVNVLIQLSLQSEDDRAEEERRRNERRVPPD
jgi:hypothetical protein